MPLRILTRLPALFVCVAIGLAAGCARQGEGRVLKLAHGLDPQHSVHKGMVFLGQRLAEKSGGALRVEVYASGQLGSERECLELVQLGGLAMTKVSASVLEGFAPEFKVFGLPYLFRDDAHKEAVLAGPIGREILAAPQSKFMRGLCYYDSGSRNFYTKKPVRTPADLKGLKIRVQESPMAFALIRAFGASATPISFGELYTALQQGVVDGAENNPPTLLAQNHYTVSKVYSLTGHLIIPEIFVFSKRTWDGLSKDDQALVKKLSRETQIEQRQLWDAYTTEAETKLKAAGVQFVQADKAAFFKATQPIRDKYGAKYAALTQRILDTK